MAIPSRLKILRSAPGDDPRLARVQDAVASMLDPIAQALVPTPLLGAPPPPWLPLTLSSGFAAVTGYAQPSWHRDALGYVHLRGRVKNSTGGASSGPCFTVPSGARPLFPTYVPCSIAGVNANSIIVDPTGAVTLSVSLADTAVFDLSGTYLAEQ